MFMIKLYFQKFEKSIQLDYFQELFSNEFAPLTTELRIGKLSCRLSVHPRPPGIASGSDTMDLIGFLPVEQLSGPPLETRHLIVPTGDNEDEPNLIVLLNQVTCNRMSDQTFNFCGLTNLQIFFNQPELFFDCFSLFLLAGFLLGISGRLT